MQAEIKAGVIPDPATIGPDGQPLPPDAGADAAEYGPWSTSDGT